MILFPSKRILLREVQLVALILDAIRFGCFGLVSCLFLVLRTRLLKGTGGWRWGMGARKHQGYTREQQTVKCNTIQDEPSALQQK